MHPKNCFSSIARIALVALGWLLLNCSQNKASDTVNNESHAIDINDTALIESLIDSVYASDKIDWPHDFDDLDTADLVYFASIRAYIPSLNPDSLTKTFGPCIEEDSFSFDDPSWFGSDEAIWHECTKEEDIETYLLEEHYYIYYDKLIPILSRIYSKWEISYKRWRFDDNHFIEIYYLLSDTTQIPIDGDIIHQAHPILEMG